MRPRTGLWMLALVVAQATAGAAPPSDSDKLYLDGVKLLKKGDVAGAVERFRLALELERTAPLLFNLAQAVAKLGRLAEARQLLQEARDLAQKSGPASIVKLASETLAELESRMPRVILELPSAARDPRVELDGKPFAVEAEGVPVEPGKHELKIFAEGYEPYAESFTLAVGDRKRIRPELEPKEKAAAPSSGDSELGEGKKPSLTGPLALGGVGLIALAGATYFFLEVKSIDDERVGLWGSSGCPGPSCPNGEPARAVELRDDAESKALVGNILLGVGAAAVVAGGAWYFLSTKSRRPTAARSGLYVVPTPAGAIVGGRL